MDYKLLISEAAYSDILKAVDWYEDHREGLGLDFELCLDAGYDDILDHPEGYQVKYRDIRVKYINRFPYGIHYLMDRNVVYVLGVFHTGVNPNKWKVRLKSK